MAMPYIPWRVSMGVLVAAVTMGQSPEVRPLTGTARAAEPDEKPAADEEIPPEVFEFVAYGEELRPQQVEKLLAQRKRLKGQKSPEARQRLKEIEAELAEHRNPTGPYVPYLPEPCRVGDRGRLLDTWVVVAQVVDDNQLIAKLYTNINPKSPNTVILRGFPTKDLADKQKWQVVVPLEVVETDDVKDGSRRKLLVLEPLDMEPYNKHWAAVVRQLKKKGR